MPLGGTNQYDYHRVERLMPFQLMSSWKAVKKHTKKIFFILRKCVENVRIRLIKMRWDTMSRFEK